jgi:hypothetical protein
MILRYVAAKGPYFLEAISKELYKAVKAFGGATARLVGAQVGDQTT